MADLSQDRVVSNNQKLYNNLLKSGKVTQDEIGDFNTFNTLLSDRSNALKLRDNLISKKNFSEAELGSHDDFLQNLDPLEGTTNKPEKTDLEYQQSSPVKPGTYNDWQLEYDQAHPEANVPVAKPEKPKEKGSFWSEMGERFTKGNADLGSMISKVPGFIYDVASVPQNIIADKFNIPGLKTSSQKVNETLGITNNVADYFDKGSDYYASKIAENNPKYQQGIVESISNGDWSTAGRNLLGGILESSAPSIAMMASAGLGSPAMIGTGTAVFGAGKKAELDKNAPQMSEQDKTMIAFSNGAIEGLFETALGAGAMGQALKNIVTKSFAEGGKDVAQKEAKKFITNTFTKLLEKNPELGMLGEGLEEVGTQFSQNAVDKYSGYRPDIKLSDGAGDAFLMGIGMGGMMAAPIRVAQYIGEDSYNNIQKRSQAKKDFAEATTAFKTIPNTNYTEAVDNIARNYTNPKDITNAFNDISKQMEVSQDDYTNAFNYLAKSVLVSSMSKAKQADIQKGINNFSDNEGNVTSATIEGEKYYIKNTADLGQPGKIIFAKNQAGEVKPFNSVLVKDWSTLSPDQITQIAQQKEAEEDNQFNASQEASAAASQVGIEPNKSVKTPNGIAKVVSVNNDGTVTVVNQKGLQDEFSIDEVEAYKTEEQKQAEKDALAQQKENEKIQAQQVEEEAKQKAEMEKQAAEKQAAEAESNIPRDKEGNPDYDAMDPETFYNEYAKEFSEEEAKAEIQDMQRAIIEDIKKKTTKKSKATSANERAAIAREIKSLNTRLDNINGVLQKDRSKTDLGSDTKWIAKNSSNPDEIVSAYEQEKSNAPVNNLKEWQKFIIGVKFNPDSFNRFGDKNNITSTLAKTWLNSDGHDIDQFIRDNFEGVPGFEDVTEQDVIDFITENPTGQLRKTTDTQNELRKRYREITGVSIDNHKFDNETLPTQAKLESFLTENNLNDSWFTTEDLQSLVTENKDKLNENDYNEFTDYLSRELTTKQSELDEWDFDDAESSIQTEISASEDSDSKKLSSTKEGEPIEFSQSSLLNEATPGVKSTEGDASIVDVENIEEQLTKLDNKRQELLIKVEPLVELKKKLYSNVDIESPKSEDEKQLEKQIASIFSEIQSIILEKRKIVKQKNENKQSESEPNFRVQDKSEAQQTIEYLQSIDKSKRNVIYLGKSDIIQYLEDNRHKYSRKTIDQVKNANFSAFYLRDEIFINSDKVKTKEDVVTNWIHERVHAQTKETLNNEELSLLYDQIGLREIQRIVPHLYWLETPNIQADEYISFASEKLLANGKLDDKIPSDIQNIILNIVNNITSINNLTNGKNNLDNFQQGIEGRNAYVGDSDRRGTEQDRTDSEGNGVGSGTRLQPDEKGSKVTFSDQANIDLKDRHNAIASITKIGTELNIPVNVVNSSELTSDNGQTALTDNGTVTIVSDRVKSVSDVIKSLVKEVATTKGLREMFSQADPNSIIGKQLAKFDELTDNEMESDKMAQIIRKAFRLTSNQFAEQDLSEIKDNLRFKIASENLPEVKDGLVVLHNTTEGKLIKSARVGGLAMPSIAIAKSDNRFLNYGEITLIGSKEMIDPKNKSNKVFGADAYTPRYPRVEYQIRNKREIEKLSEGLPADLASSLRHTLVYDIERDGDNYLDENRYVKILFAASKGADIIAKTKSKYDQSLVDFVRNIPAYDFIEVQNDEEFKKQFASEILKTLNDKVIQLYKRHGSIDENNNVDDGLLRDNFNGIKNFIRNENRTDEHQTKENAENFIKENNLQGELKHFAIGLYERLNPEERIFKGWGNTGNPKYTAHTVENAVKEMKSKAIAGEEGLSGGLGKLRSKLLKSFGSIAEIKQAQDKLVSQDELRNEINKVHEEYSSLYEKLKPYYKWDDSSIVSFYTNLEDEIVRLVRSGESESFNKLPVELHNEVKDFTKNAAALPTEYFEAKPQRAVYLNEFSGAVIPSDSDQRIRSILEENRIPYTEYTDQEERLNKVKSMTEDLGVRFRILGETGATNLDKAEEVTTRLDNLAVAREMETSGKDAKSIRLATGWEKGADGKWRYEVDDSDISFNKNILEEMKNNQTLANAVHTFSNMNYRKNEDGSYDFSMMKKGATSTSEFATYRNIPDADLEYIFDNNTELIEKIRNSEGGEGFIGANLDEAKELNIEFEHYVSGGTDLGSLIENKEMFKEYPQLKKVVVVFDPKSTSQGSFGKDLDGQNVITVKSLSGNQFKSTLLHEIQHAIQDIEGFAKGGNTEMLKNLSEKNKQAVNKIHEIDKELGFDDWAKNNIQLFQEGKSIDDARSIFAKTIPSGQKYIETVSKIKQIVYDNVNQAGGDKIILLSDQQYYRNLAGEVEARNVQTRMNMSPEERRNALLSETEDVAREDQIVLMDGLGVSKLELPETININGVERPTKNSKGQPIHSTEEGVRNFWKWFGNSKVTDESGQPLVVYHGTNADFNIFDLGKGGKNTNTNGEYGIYFTTDEKLADIFTRNKNSIKPNAGYKKGANIIASYLSIQNPKRITARQFTMLNKGAEYKKELQEKGFDGIIIEPFSIEDKESWVRLFGGNNLGSIEFNEPQYVAFYPTQIKSATSNLGTFDGNNPDIRFRMIAQNPDFKKEHERYNGKDFEIKGDNLYTTVYNTRFDTENSGQFLGTDINVNRAIDYAESNPYDYDYTGASVSISAEHLKIPIDEILKSVYKQGLYDESDFSKDDIINDEIIDFLRGKDTYNYTIDDDYYTYAESEADNANTDDLIYDVKKELSNRFNTKIDKYSTVYVDKDGNITGEQYDDNDNENREVSIRIADHTHNPQRGRPDVAVVIANKNKTSKKFYNASEDFEFDENDTSNDIADQIEEFIKDNFTPDIRFRIDKASEEVNTNPTDAQKEAGNYKKGHIKFDGFDISIENPKGSTRSGVDQDGNKWSNQMGADYGYIKGTVGKDKDHIDVFIGDKPELNKVYVVDQINPKTGAFDEHKVMLGFDGVTEARKAYQASYPKDWKGLNNITRTTKEGLKDWFKNGNTKKPFADSDVRFRLAYHGSPHQFEKFTTEKIGTGEGAQAFGWGLYFTDKKSIAEDYAKKLSKQNAKLKYQNEDVDYFESITFLNKHPEIEAAVLEIFKEYPNKPVEDTFKHNPLPTLNSSVALLRYVSKREIKSRIESGRSTFNSYGYFPNDSIEAAIALKLEEIGVRLEGSKNLYAVELHQGKEPGEYDYLRWDKNITKEQVEKINKQAEKEGLNASGVANTNYRGEWAYKELQKKFRGLDGTQEAASKFLLRAGIDGIQYPTEVTTKGSHEESFNYVIFDENAVEVKEHVRFRQADKPIQSEIGFYSPTEKALNSIQQEKGTAGQFEAMLLKNGAKEAELNWMGWKQQFPSVNQKVTKEDVQNWIDQNKVEVEEVVKGKIAYNQTPEYREIENKSLENSLRQQELQAKWWESNLDEDFEVLQQAKNEGVELAHQLELMGKRQQGEGVSKYSQYVEPGGSNYKELLLTMPKQLSYDTFSVKKTENDRWAVIHDNTGDLVITYKTEEEAKKEALKVTERRKEYPVAKPSFKSSHFDEPNILAHVRFNEREVNGERVLFLEEIQSDFSQAVRKGTTTAKTPFEKTDQWVNLALRRMMRYAAENGFDRIAWTNGEMQAARYDISKTVESIEYGRHPNGGLWTTVYGEGRQSIWSSSNTNEKELEDVIGKDMTKKIIDNSGEPISTADSRLFIEATKPQSIRELSDNVFGSEMTVLMPLDHVDGGVLATSKHDQVRKSIISFLPVDVMDILNRANISPDQLFENNNMVTSRLPIESRETVAIGIVFAIRKTGALMRTELSNLGKTRGEIFVLPTLKASDLNFREVAGIIGGRSLFHLDPSFLTPEKTTSARSITESLPIEVRNALGVEFSSAELAEFLNIHNQLINSDERSLQQRYNIPENYQLKGDNLKVSSPGMKAFYDAIVPSAANKLGKPFGARVENVDITTDANLSLSNKEILNQGKEISYDKAREVISKKDANVFLYTIDNNKPYRLYDFNDIVSANNYWEVEMKNRIMVQSLPVTSSMKESVISEGVPMFRQADKNTDVTSPDYWKNNDVTYLHNPEPAPYMGAHFGQDVEPSGKYVITGHAFIPEGTNEGTVRFKNPLIIDVTDQVYPQWKKELSERFGGKKKKVLTNAILRKGYDGIVTVENYKGKYDTKEIVILDPSSDSKGGARFRQSDITKDLSSIEQLSDIAFRTTQKNTNTVPESKNAETEAAMNKAHGLKGETILSKIDRWKQEVKETTQHFKYVTEKEFPQIYNDLRLFESIPKVVKKDAYDKIADIVRPIANDKNLYKAFERYVVISDLMHDIKSGIYTNTIGIKEAAELKGVSEKEIKDLIESGAIKTMPHEKGQRYQLYYDSVLPGAPKSDTYKQLPFNMKSVDEVETYYNELREYIDKNPSLRKVIANRNSIIYKVRDQLIENNLMSEKARDNTSYFHHMVMKYRENPEKSTAINQSYDVRVHPRGWQKSRTGSMEDYNTDYLQSEFEVIAQSLEQLAVKKSLQKIGQEVDIMPALVAQANNEGGSWRDFVPEGYTTWHPKPGTNAWAAASMAEKAIQSVIEGNPLTESLNEQLAEADQTLWVIPTAVANQLDEMKTPTKEKLPIRGMRFFNSTWKQWILLNPARLSKYMINNFSGDLDIVFAYNPKILQPKYAWTAAKELYNEATGKGMSKDMREAIENAVISSGLSIQEIPDVNKEGVFKTLTGENNLFKKYWNTATSLNDFREGMLRLAAYKFFKEELNAGKTHHGVSNPKAVDALRSNEEKAGKMARELLGDYGNLSQGGVWLRSHAYPFWSWMEINAPRYYKLLRNTYQDTNSAPRTVGAAIRKTAISSTALAARIMLLSALITAWNRLFFPDEDDELTKTGNRQLRLITGRRDDGSIITLRIQGAFSDVLSFVGLEDAFQDVKDVRTGKTTAGKKVKEAGSAFVNRVGQGAMPFERLTGELITGKSVYPDILHPRPIIDRAEHAFRMVSLDKVYRFMTKKPLKKGGKELIGLVLYETDPGEAAYYAMRQRIYDFLDEKEYERPSGDPTEKSIALRYYKQAKKFKDTKLENHWWAKYKALGGTKEGMKMSIKKGEVTSALPKEYKREFLDKLDGEDREVLEMAERWYNETYKK